MSLSQKVLLGLGIYWLLGKAGVAAYEQIEWEILPTRLQDLHPLKGYFDFRLKIKNKLPVDISLKDFVGELKVKDDLFATIDSQDNISLPSGQEIILSAQAKLDKDGLFEDLKALKNMPIQVTSYLKTSVIDIPISNKIYLFYYVV